MTSFRESVFGRVLGRIAAVVCRHPRWFIAPQVALAALCGVYSSQYLRLDTTRNNLLGPRLKSHQVFLRFRQEFPAQDEMVVMVESGDPELNRQFLERLAARLQKQPDLFVDLFYKGDVRSLGRKGLLLVPVADLVRLRDSLHDYLPAVRTFARATNLDSLFGQVNRQFRSSAAGTNASTAAMLKSLPFLTNLLRQANESLSLAGDPPGPEIEALFSGGPQAEQQVYINFEHGRIYVLSVRARSAAVVPQSIDRLRQLLGQTQLEVPGVDVGLTGGPVLDYDEMRQSERDSLVASATALVLCSLIFIGAYRQVGRPLKAAVCLLVGLGYTMGYTTAVVGHLNILSITFAPMLIGLGIDYGIHFITRYEEEMRNRHTEVEAVEKATVFTGRGIVTGGLTTAGAFLAMALTNFKGIREVGLISGGGLLLCLIPMMTMLPALLLRGPQNVRDHKLGPVGGQRMRVENIWLQRPWLLIGLALGLCGLAVPLARKVYFDYNLLHMQSQRLASVIYEKRLLRAGGHSAVFAVVLADSAAQARDYEQRIKRLPSVAGVDSAANLLGGDQARKLELVRAIKSELADLRFAPIDRRPVDVDSLGATLWYLSGYLGLATDHAQREAPDLARELNALRGEINELRKAMLNAKPPELQQLTRFQQALFENLHRFFGALRNQDTSGPLQPGELPPALRDRFIGVTGKFLLQVYPRKDVWDHDNQREFIGQLSSAVPAQRVTGTPVQLYEYTTLLKVSYQQAALYSLAAIAVMVFLHFRSLLSVILALLPVALGSLWLLGFMGLADVPFNPANIMTLPLIVGIGVTNGIQVLNRFVEEQNPAILAKSTGKAVLVSGLAALTGFATLLLAKHQGIRSLGEVMSVGIAACMVAGLTFLPALLCLMMRCRWQPERRVEA